MKFQTVTNPKLWLISTQEGTYIGINEINPANMPSKIPNFRSTKNSPVA